MYSENEMRQIFSGLTTLDQMDAICEIFFWLIDERFMEKSFSLYKISHEAYNEVNVTSGDVKTKLDLLLENYNDMLTHINMEKLWKQ